MYVHPQVLDRTLLPLVNEGFKTLEEGIAFKESDVDVVYVYGYAPASRATPATRCTLGAPRATPCIHSHLLRACMHRYGFPRKAGGPLHWARHVRPGGLAKVVDDLRMYGQAHPGLAHWQPSALLVSEAAAQAAKRGRGSTL